VVDTPGGPDQLDRLGLLVVPMSPQMAPALDRFHERLTPATIRNRFFGPHPHLTADELARFTSVDHVDQDALVALDGDGEIVAVARFIRLGHGSTRAEVAFVVADPWQRKGVGGALFARLAARAREVGVKRFVADTLTSNRGMRTVFRQAGLAYRESERHGVVQVTIDLAPD
jgi:GNAT superfamily N-acetyltransferase